MTDPGGHILWRKEKILQFEVLNVIGCGAEGKGGTTRADLFKERNKKNVLVLIERDKGERGVCVCKHGKDSSSRCWCKIVD